MPLFSRCNWLRCNIRCCLSSWEIMHCFLVHENLFLPKTLFLSLVSYCPTTIVILHLLIETGVEIRRSCQSFLEKFWHNGLPIFSIRTNFDKFSRTKRSSINVASSYEYVMVCLLFSCQNCVIHYERRSALEQVTVVYEKLLSYKLSYFKLAGDKFVKGLKEISGKICHNVMMLTIIHRCGLFSIEHV